jgi:ABC-type multidrug transport system ATPase subunit
MFNRSHPIDQYKHAVNVSSLVPDLRVLPNNDATEIGEKGINLSGGQKQRVSIARAVLSDAAIYLLDDPLSAVDAHVGKKLWQEVLVGELRSKTRLLVTNQLHFLDDESVDQILVLDNGCIVEQGKYHELMSTEGGVFQTLASSVTMESGTESGGKASGEARQVMPSSSEADGKVAGVDAASAGAGAAGTFAGDKDDAGANGAVAFASQQSNGDDNSQGADNSSIVQAEEKSNGTVKAEVWLAYVAAVGGCAVFSFIVLLFWSVEFLQVLAYCVFLLLVLAYCAFLLLCACVLPPRSNPFSRPPFSPRPQLFVDVWVMWWIDDVLTRTDDFYVTVYGSMAVCMLTMLLVRSLGASAHIHASRNIHALHTWV